MSNRVRRAALFGATVLLSASVALALVPHGAPERWRALVKPDPARGIGVVAEQPSELPSYTDERASWDAFRGRYGADWRVHVDRRSGVPLLVEGPGIEWMPAGSVPATASLESLARAFVAEHALLFRVRGEELVLSPEGSGRIDDDHAILTFGRAIDGRPVDDQLFTMYVTRGRLVAFGADRWAGTPAPVAAPIGVDAARQRLLGYLGLLPYELRELAPAAAVYVGAVPRGVTRERYTGATGAGIELRPAWEFRFRFASGPETWVGKVDDETGEVLAFYDDNQYGSVKGGVFPVSNDGGGWDGSEQPGWPMPYADVSGSSGNQTADDMGLFSGSGTSTTILAGPYVKVQDNCGAISQSSAASGVIDLLQGPGTDCTVPAGASAGDTHSTRSGFYHLNRSAEKGRVWLPDNSWLKSQLVDNVNINATCNAFWNGSVNFYKSGGGCRNTGEIAAIFVHEWGHGLDQNDGGGYDNPSEVYGDGVAFIQLHTSCIGRGFHMSSNCDGYGDACLNCTGVRDQDWDRHASHTPATPGGFIKNNCGWGFSTGPCGKEVHCESYLAGEALWDLAARDFTASGLDQATSWQLLDKLFYKSRKGSGGNMYNCSLPTADGCGSSSMFTKLRTADDDDGNLSNGTPHAAAIFAAFNRHGIACGAAGDGSNKNHAGCTSPGTPVLTVAAGNGQNTLTWTAVSGAAKYLVLRNDQSCDGSHTIIATVDGGTTSYVDSNIPAGFTVYYAVQAQASNQACESALSNCLAGAPAQGVGSISLDKPAYACSATITAKVTDGNVSGPTVTVRAWSNTESAPETFVLTQTAAGSTDYAGPIPLTSAPAMPGNGQLSVSGGDQVTVEYIDADDGQGGVNQPRRATAAIDCTAPLLSAIATANVTDTSATITWTTDTNADSRVHWGPSAPPANDSSAPELVTSHAVTLSGLAPCTTYVYAVESADAVGNATLDNNHAQYFRFETLGNFGGSLAACHAGRVQLVRPVIACRDTVQVNLTDADLNVSPTQSDTAVVYVSSSTEFEPEAVTVTETGPNTSQFAGTLGAGPGAPVHGDVTLSVSAGDLLTATYHDANDGTGHSAIATHTGIVDCEAPHAGSVQVTNISAGKATVQWTTSEPTTGRVEWGPTAALGNTVPDNTSSTTHAVVLQPLVKCGGYFFRIVTTDAYGNTTVDDQGGGLYVFNAGKAGAVVFRDSFETPNGWKLGGEWQIAAPRGLGSPADPSSAADGRKVLGDDLTGLGAHPGEYESATITTATSPSIDASALENGALRFQRWLNVAGRAVSSVEVYDGSWHTVWSSSKTTDSAWTLQTIDIAQYADHNANLQVRFRQQGNGDPAPRSGWNVDVVEVFDNTGGAAADTAGGACGGCGGAPAFAGATSAADANPCGGGGINLSWAAAAAWGTGNGGTYTIWRDTLPNFAPAASNRIATGISGTTYNDPAPPAGVTLYYLVRAENDESCGTGSNNAGVVDTNSRYVAARDDASQPAATAVDGSLRLQLVNGAHVRLAWTPATNAASYHVLRALTPAAPFDRVGTPARPPFESQNDALELVTRYYLVRSSDACGNETP